MNYDVLILVYQGLWQYTKVSIPDPTDASSKIFNDGKKDEVVRVITTYIS
jgi:hypothetical protein